MMSNEPVIEVEVETVPDTRIPVLTPLLNLFRSRKFIITLAALVSEYFIYAEPSLAPAEGVVAGAIAILAATLVGTIAWEDRAAIEAEARITAVETNDINQLVIEAVTEALTQINKPNQE